MTTGSNVEIMSEATFANTRCANETQGNRLWSRINSILEGWGQMFSQSHQRIQRGINGRSSLPIGGIHPQQHSPLVNQFPELLHSRRIGLNEGKQVPIYGGARVTGMIGKWDLGFLDMQTHAVNREAGMNSLSSENFGQNRVK